MQTVPQLIKIATTAALEAGEAIMGVYSLEDFGVEIKSDKSPLTKADKAAHQIISNRLSNTGLPILSEEGINIPFIERRKWDYFWLVDPLDGTKEFISKSGEFTVNIALMQKEAPVGGVIYAPCLYMLYYGSKETGVYKIEKEKQVELPSAQKKRAFEEIQEKEQVIVVASKSHLNAETSAFISQFRNTQLTTMGSSLKFMLLADASADVYPRLGPTMEWDTAAAHALLQALNKGIYKTDLQTELVYNKQYLLNPSFVAF